MKKTIISLLTAAAGIISQTAAAQTVTGTWEMLPGYSTPSKIVETPEYVYVQSASSLCGYDKTTGEVLALNATNRLNGNNVKNFWYNPEEGYMFVLHTDENIDLVYDDGRTINVPDLRDATITVDKTVNDVGFAGGKAYVGTKSGMLVIDAEHGAVTESTLWGKNVIAIAATEKKIIMWIGWADGGMYVADRAGSHHNFDQSFTKTAAGGVYSNTKQPFYLRISDNKLLTVNGATPYIINVDNDATDNSKVCTAASIANVTLDNTAIDLPTKDGALLKKDDKLYYIGADGTLKKTVTVAEANGKLAADRNATGEKVWLADANGYGQYDVAAGAYAITPVRPSGTSGTNVGMLRQASNGDIYISTLPRKTSSISSDGQVSRFDIWTQEKGFSPLNWSAPSNLYSMTINPNNEKELLTSFRTSVRRFNTETNSEFVYTTANTPFVSGLLFNDVKVDKDGNLWVLHISGGSKPIIYKALAGSWETEVKPEGWSRFEIPNFTSGDHSPRFVIDEHNHIIVITGYASIAAIQMPDKNEALTQSTPAFVHSLSTDSDGISTAISYTIAISIDKTNRIWCGSRECVFFIPNAKQMLQTSFNITRPKVARNDGTNLADFLLDNVEVADLYVDENNEKWISTIGSGLYRVNADGTQIIERYHLGNSDIPSDNVYCALADKNSNKIFVGTDKGLAIYHSTTAPAAKDYDEVYAYPNPVTPDYTGYITITGLKANSLVKIADAAGNVFYETKSDGGLATWNGCDASGRRVKSGVYFVFASQSGENISSSGAVTKIVVVN